MPGLFYDSGNESSHRCTLPLSPFEETVLQIRSALLAAALMVALPQIALSQSDNSSLSGAVTDTSGALLPNARVTVRNTATGAESVSTTNSSGNFILPNVEPGKYTVRIESPGFQSATVENVLVDASIGRRVDVSLRIGDAGSTVTVQAGVDSVQTERCRRRSTRNAGAGQKHSAQRP